MLIDFPEEEKQFRNELRAYFRDILTPQIRRESRNHTSPLYRDTIKRIGQDGWLAIGWPKQYGGQGKGEQMQMAFFEEAYRADCPVPLVTLNTVAPALMQYGSEEQKNFYLPKIAAGEIHFAIGYTEPQAGTDLAALQTRAELQGDEFVINGQKIFTTGGNDAEYVWLACRTDKDAPKHKGISIVIVPRDSEGFSFSPIRTVGGEVTTVTFYDNIRVPATNLVGELNKGWQLITHQLNHERIALGASGIFAQRDFQYVLDWAREPNSQGLRPIDTPHVQQKLAEVLSQLKAMRNLNARMAWCLENGALDPALASAMKVYGSECSIECYRILLDLIGPDCHYELEDFGYSLHEHLRRADLAALIFTFGGGVNEVQRELITRFGIGMAKSR